MNKLDLMILAGAGAMTIVAGGLWFSREDVMILTSMERSADVPLFKRGTQADHAAERRRIAAVVPRVSDTPADAAFLKAAKRLRNSPCSGAAKTEYLAAMTVYARTNLRDNLAAARKGERDGPSTQLEAQASEYFDHMPAHGYISSAEFRAAMKEITPGLGLAIAASENAGEALDMSMGADACDRRRTGEANPRMSWEPEDGAPDDRRFRSR